MKNKGYIAFFVLGILGAVHFNSVCAQNDYTKYVDRFIGTAGNGCVSPVAAVPFGMVQLGPNTYTSGSGYHHTHNQILGFSHVNKSGGGCGDFLDVLFNPLRENRWDPVSPAYPEKGFPTPFSHVDESASPGYYRVQLDGIDASLTTTPRCGFHRYKFSDEKGLLAIDLKHGNEGTCTIVEEDSEERIVSTGLRIIDNQTVEGWRISSGWAQEQHVYFYAKFSEPFTRSESQLFDGSVQISSDSAESSGGVRCILSFPLDGTGELLVKVGISPVSCAGAKANLKEEMPHWDFKTYHQNARMAWNRELSKINVDTEDESKKRLFYSSLFNVLLYPMLYSDVDGRYRGPDHEVHRANGFNYYGGVVGLWDTFRAAVPLLTLLRPDIVNDYIRTFIAHYDHFGQLPIWVLAGNETFQMIGIHALPIIADGYLKGIRNYDVEKAYAAMRASAMKDTIGYSMRYFVGLVHYKKYGYVPADLEMEATARTLEYAYDDWCLAQMAKSLGKTEDFEYFMRRSRNYRNVYDKEAGFMNGRFSNGQFSPDLNPYHSDHRRDDFCEGNAWQWTFFVPHDVEGLAQLMGGKDKLLLKLDQLFAEAATIEGENISHDISGMIGQYAHGNEPSHHIAYMYNHLDKAGKTQDIVYRILTDLYDDTPTGICGNEDTGQMSAWYVFSSMGFYPMNPTSQQYELGRPLFDEVQIQLSNGRKLTIVASGSAGEKNLVRAVSRNGNAVAGHSIDYKELMKGGVLKFEMDGDIRH